MNEEFASRILRTAVAEPPHAVTVEAVRGAVRRRRRRRALTSLLPAAAATGIAAAALLSPARPPVFTFAGADGPLTRAQAVSAEATLLQRLRFLGLHATGTVTGERIQVRAPVPAAWLASLEQIGAVQFRPVLRVQALPSPARCPKPGTGSSTACDQQRATLFTLGPAIVTNAELTRVRAAGTTVSLTFSATGKRLLAAASGRLSTLAYPRDEIAIWVDGTVIAAPAVESVIAGGQAQIAVDFTPQQAMLLAAVLSGTPLPEHLALASS